MLRRYIFRDKNSALLVNKIVAPPPKIIMAEPSFVISGSSIRGVTIHGGTARNIHLKVIIRCPLDTFETI
jgi:hypothetical protein